jgi:hypothetical protein
MGWVFNTTPRPLYPRERPGTHYIGAGWASEPFCTGVENLAPNGIRSPNRPSHSESLYRRRYSGSYILQCAGLRQTEQFTKRRDGVIIPLTLFSRPKLCISMH